MSARTWEVAANVRADVGEGPAWDDRDGVLWFVDVSPGALFRLDPTSGMCERRLMGQPLGAAIPAEDGRMVLALEDGLLAYSWSADERRLIVNVEADNLNVRMNDAKCDPRGRLWAGTMAYDFAQGASTLYRFDNSGPTAIVGGCTIANGTGWSPDGSTMYFVDTPTLRIDAFSYDIETGNAEDRRPWVTIEDGVGVPDGLTIDAEGCVWVAMWGGGAVRRYSPEGTLEEVVNLPVSQVSSACFGGASMTDLFVTSAAYQLSDAMRASEPLCGATFVVSTDVKGCRSVPVDLATLAPETKPTH